MGAQTKANLVQLVPGHFPFHNSQSCAEAGKCQTVHCFLDLSKKCSFGYILLASDGTKSFQLDYRLACYYKQVASITAG